MALLADPAAAERPAAGRLLAPAFPAPNDAPDDDRGHRAADPGAAPSRGRRARWRRRPTDQSAEPGSTEPPVGRTSTRELDGRRPTTAPPARTAHGTPSRPSRLGRSRRPGAGRHSRPSRPAGRAGDQRRSARRCRRFTLVGSAAMVLALALAGAGILASRDALPGDGLYTVKRVAESAGLALTFDEMSRAHRHLDLASTRLGEVEQLVATDPRVSTEDPELVTSAIQEFDDSTGEGARILLADEDAGNAERPRRPAQLGGRAVGPAGRAAAGPAGRRRDRGRPAAAEPGGRAHRGAAGPAACATPPGRRRRPGPGAQLLPAATGATRSQDASGADDPAPAGDRRPDRARTRSSGSDARTGSRRRTPVPAPARTPAGGPPPTATSRGLLDPVEDTLDGVLGGSSDDSPSTTSTAPNNVRTTTADSSDAGRRRRRRPAA